MHHKYKKKKPKSRHPARKTSIFSLILPRNNPFAPTDMTPHEPLYGKTPDELARLCAELGMPRFAARQLARWLHVRRTEDPALMTDIAAAAETLIMGEPI